MESSKGFLTVAHLMGFHQIPRVFFIYFIQGSLNFPVEGDQTMQIYGGLGFPL